MTMDEIKKKVENFELVSKTDIKDLNIGTTIIYFEKIFDKKTDSVKFKYKPGGRIIVNKKEYLVVTNGKTNWSVQLKNHIIFKMMPVINIQKKFDIQIEKLKLLIKEERKNYKKELSNYEKKLSDKDIIIKKLKYKLKKYQ
jgi:penicillin V acylase-like amidase (Ntn superfamily)